jgi:anti-sigma-K factor RskA
VESYVVESLTREERLRFLRALEEDAEFRYAVAGAIGILTVVEELKKLREDFNRLAELEEKRWEENGRRWEENEQALGGGVQEVRGYRGGAEEVEGGPQQT